MNVEAFDATQVVRVIEGGPWISGAAFDFPNTWPNASRS